MLLSGSDPPAGRACWTPRSKVRGDGHRCRCESTRSGGLGAVRHSSRARSPTPGKASSWAARPLGAPTWLRARSATSGRDPWMEVVPHGVNERRCHPRNGGGDRTRTSSRDSPGGSRSRWASSNHARASWRSSMPSIGSTSRRRDLTSRGARLAVPGPECAAVALHSVAGRAEVVVSLGNRDGVRRLRPGRRRRTPPPWVSPAAGGQRSRHVWAPVVSFLWDES